MNTRVRHSLLQLQDPQDQMSAPCNYDITMVRNVEEKLRNAGQQTQDFLKEFIEIELQGISCLRYYNDCHILFPGVTDPIAVFTYLSDQKNLDQFITNAIFVVQAYNHFLHEVEDSSMALENIREQALALIPADIKESEAEIINLDNFLSSSIGWNYKWRYSTHSLSSWVIVNEPITFWLSFDTY